MYSELVQIKGKIDFTKTYVMFYLINFIDMFQTSWDRVQQKTWKVVKCFKKNLFGIFHRETGYLVTGDSIMIGMEGAPRKAQPFTSENVFDHFFF